MAQRMVTQLVDDLDGEELADGSGETVRFGLDGTTYEIDLSHEHADTLRSALAPFIAAGRITSGTAAPSGGPSRRRRSVVWGTSSPEELANIRHWAAANGYTVAPRGRVAKAVRDAYHAAHA